jgi:hypothetical protein
MDELEFIYQIGYDLNDIQFQVDRLKKAILDNDMYFASDLTYEIIPLYCNELEIKVRALRDKLEHG